MSESSWLYVKVKIFRYNPDVDFGPSYQTYVVPWEEKGNVLQVLKAIYDDHDRTLAFPYYACGFKYCNGCMMTINGKVAHACLTLVDPGDELILEPLKSYPIIRDLVVDRGRKYVMTEGTYEISRGAVIKEVKGHA